MKAKIRAIDELFHKTVEVECSIYKDGNPAQELLKSARSKAIRERIVKELQLSFGEARLELISYGRVIAEGTISRNVFSGGGNVTAKECIPRAA